MHHVLLVEDDSKSARLVRLMAGRAGFHRLSHAQDLAEAESILAQDGADAILLSLSLPGTPGLAALQALQARFPAVPLITLVDDADPDLESQAREAGVVVLSRESLSPARLRETLHAVLAASGSLSEERLRRVLNASLDALVVIDSQGEIQEFNAAAVSLLGEDIRAGRPFPLPCAGPGEPGTAEIPLGDRVIELRCSDLAWGPQSARLVSLRDVTAARRAEQLQAELARAHHLVAVGQLAASIAHEINNPAAALLSGLQEMAQALRSLPGHDPARQEALQSLESLIDEGVRNVQRIARIVRDLRDSIPQTLPPPQPEVTAPRPPLASGDEKLRVLLIDDNESLLRSLSRLLGRFHRVETAASGGQALAMIAADPRYDAVLCDLMMPGVDGMALLAHLREIHPDLADRLIFLTGGGLTAQARRFRQEHPAIFLDKPATVQEVLAALDRLQLSLKKDS